MLMQRLYRLQSLFNLIQKTESGAGAETEGPSSISFPPVQKSEADQLMAMAKVFAGYIATLREKGKEAFGKAIADEKRRKLKFCLRILLESQPTVNLQQSFLSGGMLVARDAHEALETAMYFQGTSSALKNSHPAVVLKVMSAFLGVEASAQADEWIAERYKHRSALEEELILPGDMPDIILSNLGNTARLERTIRLAGPQLAGTALSGCPREILSQLEHRIFSTCGTILLHHDIEVARADYSSDEIADAQNAFMELLETMKISEMEETSGMIEPEKQKMPQDPLLVADLSNLIMETEEKLLKDILIKLSPQAIAVIVQGVEPAAHDRIFSTLPAGKARRVLDALEASTGIDTLTLTRNAQIFAQQILSEISQHHKITAKQLPITGRLRQLLSAILSRE